ncbi:Alkaline phosphatase D [Fusarium oxysporum f. sp. albedinis]|nr:Alkaline phosphatase D [Fusarium oxysporum f. sp. albedinis]
MNPNASMSVASLVKRYQSLRVAERRDKEWRNYPLPQKFLEDHGYVSVYNSGEWESDQKIDIQMRAKT